jgi:hypothetical protein
VKDADIGMTKGCSSTSSSVNLWSRNLMATFRSRRVSRPEDDNSITVVLCVQFAEYGAFSKVM